MPGSANLNREQQIEVASSIYGILMSVNEAARNAILSKMAVAAFKKIYNIEGPLPVFHIEYVNEAFVISCPPSGSRTWSLAYYFSDRKVVIKQQFTHTPVGIPVEFEKCITVENNKVTCVINTLKHPKAEKPALQATVDEYVGQVKSSTGIAMSGVELADLMRVAEDVPEIAKKIADLMPKEEKPPELDAAGQQQVQACALFYKLVKGHPNKKKIFSQIETNLKKFFYGSAIPKIDEGSDYIEISFEANRSHSINKIKATFTFKEDLVTLETSSKKLDDNDVEKHRKENVSINNGVLIRGNVTTKFGDGTIEKNNDIRCLLSDVVNSLTTDTHLFETPKESKEVPEQSIASVFSRNPMPAAPTPSVEELVREQQIKVISSIYGILTSFDESVQKKVLDESATALKELVKSYNPEDSVTASHEHLKDEFILYCVHSETRTDYRFSARKVVILRKSNFEYSKYTPKPVGFEQTFTVDNNKVTDTLEIPNPPKADTPEQQKFLDQELEDFKRTALVLVQRDISEALTQLIDVIGKVPEIVRKVIELQVGTPKESKKAPAQSIASIASLNPMQDLPSVAISSISTSTQPSQEMPGLSTLSSFYNRMKADQKNDYQQLKQIVNNINNRFLPRKVYARFRIHVDFIVIEFELNSLTRDEKDFKYTYTFSKGKAVLMQQAPYDPTPRNAPPYIHYVNTVTVENNRATYTRSEPIYLTKPKTENEETELAKDKALFNNTFHASSISLASIALQPSVPPAPELKDDKSSDELMRKQQIEVASSIYGIWMSFNELAQTEILAAYEKAFQEIFSAHGPKATVSSSYNESQFILNCDSPGIRSEYRFYDRKVVINRVIDFKSEYTSETAEIEQTITVENHEATHTAVTLKLPNADRPDQQQNLAMELEGFRLAVLDGGESHISKVLTDLMLVTDKVPAIVDKIIGLQTPVLPVAAISDEGAVGPSNAISLTSIAVQPSQRMQELSAQIRLCTSFYNRISGDSSEGGKESRQRILTQIVANINKRYLPGDAQANFDVRGDSIVINYEVNSPTESEKDYSYTYTFSNGKVVFTKQAPYDPKMRERAPYISYMDTLTVENDQTTCTRGDPIYPTQKDLRDRVKEALAVDIILFNESSSKVTKEEEQAHIAFLLQDFSKFMMPAVLAEERQKLLAPSGPAAELKESPRTPTTVLPVPAIHDEGAVGPSSSMSMSLLDGTVGPTMSTVLESKGTPMPSAPPLPPTAPLPEHKESPVPSAPSAPPAERKEQKISDPNAIPSELRPYYLKPKGREGSKEYFKPFATRVYTTATHEEFADVPCLRLPDPKVLTGTTRVEVPAGHYGLIIHNEQEEFLKPGVYHLTNATTFVKLQPVASDFTHGDITVSIVPRGHLNYLTNNTIEMGTPFKVLGPGRHVIPVENTIIQKVMDPNELDITVEDETVPFCTKVCDGKAGFIKTNNGDTWILEPGVHMIKGRTRTPPGRVSSKVQSTPVKVTVNLGVLGLTTVEAVVSYQVPMPTVIWDPETKQEVRDPKTNNVVTANPKNMWTTVTHFHSDEKDIEAGIKDLARKELLAEIQKLGENVLTANKSLLARQTTSEKDTGVKFLSISFTGVTPSADYETELARKAVKAINDDSQSYRENTLSRDRNSLEAQAQVEVLHQDTAELKALEDELKREQQELAVLTYGGSVARPTPAFNPDGGPSFVHHRHNIAPLSEEKEVTNPRLKRLTLTPQQSSDYFGAVQRSVDKYQNYSPRIPIPCMITDGLMQDLREGFFIKLICRYLPNWLAKMFLNGEEYLVTNDQLGLITVNGKPEFLKPGSYYLPPGVTSKRPISKNALVSNQVVHVEHGSIHIFSVPNDKLVYAEDNTVCTEEGNLKDYGFFGPGIHLVDNASLGHRAIIDYAQAIMVEKNSEEKSRIKKRRDFENEEQNPDNKVLFVTINQGEAGIYYDEQGELRVLKPGMTEIHERWTFLKRFPTLEQYLDIELPMYTADKVRVLVKARVSYQIPLEKVERAVRQFGPNKVELEIKRLAIEQVKQQILAFGYISDITVKSSAVAEEIAEPSDELYSAFANGASQRAGEALQKNQAIQDTGIVIKGVAIDSRITPVHQAVAKAKRNSMMDKRQAEDAIKEAALKKDGPFLRQHRENEAKKSRLKQEIRGVQNVKATMVGREGRAANGFYCPTSSENAFSRGGNCPGVYPT